MNNDNQYFDIHLTNSLILIDLLLHREIIRLGMRNKQTEKWHATRGLFVTGEKLNKLSTGNNITNQWFRIAYPNEIPENELDTLNKTIDIQKKKIEDAKETDDAIAENRIELLAERFELLEDEKLILLVCLIPAIDAKYEQIFSYLSEDANKKYPCPDIILKILSDTFEERISKGRFFASQSPLFTYHLLEFIDQGAERNLPVYHRQIKRK